MVYPQRIVAVLAATSLAMVPAVPTRADASPGVSASGPTAAGYGGAIATVDATATAVGLDVLRRGGNAVDAAVAAAATLGVTEPFSAGIGGGGFFVYYDARSRTVHTIDGRETAPAAMGADAFVNPATGRPYDFTEARISGLSAGVPGTLLTWREALRQWGTRPLSALLTPAAQVAERGFPVDATFPVPGRGERRRLRPVQLDQPALPAEWSGARGRYHPTQPRPRRHLPADRPRRCWRLLHRPGGAGHRRHGRAATGRGRADRKVGLSDPARWHVAG
jgi:hypothetical protein